MPLRVLSCVLSPRGRCQPIFRLHQVVLSVTVPETSTTNHGESNKETAADGRAPQLDIDSVSASKIEDRRTPCCTEDGQGNIKQQQERDRAQIPCIRCTVPCDTFQCHNTVRFSPTVTQIVTLVGELLARGTHSLHYTD